MRLPFSGNQHMPRDFPGNGCDWEITVEIDVNKTVSLVWDR
jgi:hypothetical protein